MDLFILFGVWIAGTLIAVISIFMIIGNRVTEPRKDLERKVHRLENEVRVLKSREPK
ncbi:hypothetical protein GCM10010954_11280 [Halobacillus andaensis]|uniref:Uncharacterized protein n=1 Tax=Halobacillus andaensis TaxID=1176239 RepID=A0A917B2S7_HALAA|nr:hypothetical protein [Halobacillus andaensis]MBP2003923.1 beta-lactamase regulating signal transducer with metallopeptidase domain [Halobacillus andaensis]GGF14383.1 hypothetical protein GCM10010954_11280 [Halobacillus andaensis]